MKCPEHGGDYETVKTSYEQFGVMLKDVKPLRNSSHWSKQKQSSIVAQCWFFVLPRCNIN